MRARDFIVGKRFWSHLDDYFDSDPYGPAVLYWYKTVRNPKAPGGAELVPHLIHNLSGAGSDVLAVDLNGRWKNGYCHFHEKWNLYLLGKASRQKHWQSALSR